MLQSEKNNKTEELFLKVEELLCKYVGKLKLFAATLGIDGEQIRTSKGRRDLKNTIIKVLEGQLDEKGKTDEEKCDVFKHTIEDLKFYIGDHQTAQPDQKENGKKATIGADSNVDDG